MVDRQPDATQALISHSSGDTSAASLLLPLVYDRLRALASGYMRRERAGHTLRPTALVHEAYLQLIDQDQVEWQGKTHFLAVAAIQMRRILIDHARERNADKRGGRAIRITLADVDGIVESTHVIDALALEEALASLAKKSQRQARVVELRFFGGLSVEETAYVLGVSQATVKGDWRVARAWLAAELTGSPSRLDSSPSAPRDTD